MPTGARARLTPNPFAGHRVGLSTGADPDVRDEWAAAVAAARDFSTDAVELCALRAARLADLGPYLESHPDVLEPFGYVSVHAPAGEGVGRWAQVVEQLAGLPGTIETIVVHPDLASDRELVLLETLGRRLCFENMDCAKSDGRFAQELTRVFDACPAAGFCLDVAHVLTHDESLALAFELLESFGDRLRQVHVSGIEPDGTHRVMTSDDVESYLPVLKLAQGLPLILESLPAQH